MTSDQSSRTENSGDPKKRRNFIVRTWKWFWAPAGSVSLGLLMIGGFFTGILFWGGYNWAMDLSNTETFCISCHEMADKPFDELKKTVHYSSPSGVRATCSDCHVPKQWHHKAVRKVRATKDLFHNIVGTISTSEKYEAHRLNMALSVWESMKSTDSRECRNCHTADSMNLRVQKPAARRQDWTVPHRRARSSPASLATTT